MPFSHHSHSGQFCAHAKDTLEACVQQAIAKNLRVFCLTEHMPRALPRDLYPEEQELKYTPQNLADSFAEYYRTAVSLRDKYQHQITILVGFEIDWIRPSMLQEIATLREKYAFDIFVGSVHHVDEVPIDFSTEMYQHAITTVESNDRAARESSGTTPPDRFPEVSPTDSTGETRIFEAYFDTQYSMLTALKPPVIGHFDLVRLKCENHTIDLTAIPSVYERVLRNIKFIASYGGMVEINTAALRKGWQHPYPGPDVLDVMKREGVKFVLSDDSHGVEQVAYGYGRCLQYLHQHDVEEVWYYEWLGTQRIIKDGFLTTQVDGQQLPEIGSANVEAKKIRIEDLKRLLREW
ncbi:histidinolphosphatase [Orbilia brochopaga]|uniref:Histidinol-phosphatase n=1 Tax=Orbilia brochopaga TaxID=3140254 RepID=A0AAV9VBL8_9PEZI